MKMMYTKAAGIVSIGRRGTIDITARGTRGRSKRIPVRIVYSIFLGDTNRSDVSKLLLFTAFK
jgi:hypothetical protein